MINFDYGVELGPLRDENAGRYYQARNNPAIWKWCRQCDVIQVGQHVNWLQNVTSDTSKIRMYEIIDSQQELLGVCGLTDIDHINRRAEFSLYILPEYHKKGFGRKALKTLFKHGFYNLGLNSIWGETYEGNPALELFLSLGMTHEGTRDEFYYRDGGFIDCHLISLTRSVFDDVEKTWPKTKLRRIK